MQNYNPELSYSTLQSVVEERGCYYFKGLIHIQKEKKMCFILYGVYVSSVADLNRPKKRVTPWSKRNRPQQNVTGRNIVKDRG